MGRTEGREKAGVGAWGARGEGFEKALEPKGAEKLEAADGA